MRIQDLTTLENVRSWLQITSTTHDALLSRLITASSAYVQSWLNRIIASAEYTETRDGTGTDVIVFANYPVTSVQSLVINTVPYTLAQDSISPGYGYDSKRIWLQQPTLNVGSYRSTYNYFPRGRGNVVLAYTAGYLIPSEQQTATASIYISSLNYSWIGDSAVRYANGTVFTKVAASPALGQYAILNDSNGTYYSFNASDIGQTILISYSYVPYDVEQATIDLIALKYRELDRIGSVSKSIGGETISFNTKDMTDNIKTLLNQYKKVITI